MSSEATATDPINSSKDSAAVYSFVIPVYNRAGELDELLESLCQLTADTPFEVVVVDDGSQQPCRETAMRHADRLRLQYHYINNCGPGQARNNGVDRSNGQYVIFLDSDCTVPPHYMAEVDTALQQTQADAFGGPDRSHPSFTPVQKAISYAMTSFFTTGGIRGGKASLDKFYPRSFNMGIRREVFNTLGGYSNMRFGEDIDLSLRIVGAGYRSCLFSKAWVYHKRRTSLKKFFKQVTNSGIARINLYKKYPSSLKLVHCLPAAFTLGTLIMLLLGIFANSWFISPLVLYALLVLVDATAQNRSLKVGLLSVAASFTQLTGYGLGFINAAVRRLLLKQDEYQAFKKNFYK